MNDELFNKCKVLTQSEWYEISGDLNKTYPITLQDKGELILLRDNQPGEYHAHKR